MAVWTSLTSTVWWLLDEHGLLMAFVLLFLEESGLPPIIPGDLLVISSDGIAEQHLDDIDFAAPATTIAEKLVGRYGRETDDALVLAARHRGTS